MWLFTLYTKELFIRFIYSVLALYLTFFTLGHYSCEVLDMVTAYSSKQYIQLLFYGQSYLISPTFLVSFSISICLTTLTTVSYQCIDFLYGSISKQVVNRWVTRIFLLYFLHVYVYWSGSYTMLLQFFFQKQTDAVLGLYSSHIGLDFTLFVHTAILLFYITVILFYSCLRRAPSITFLFLLPLSILLGHAEEYHFFFWVILTCALLVFIVHVYKENLSQAT